MVDARDVTGQRDGDVLDGVVIVVQDDRVGGLAGAGSVAGAECRGLRAGGRIVSDLLNRPAAAPLLRGLRMGLAVLAVALAVAAGAAAYPGLTIVYAPGEGARAIHDGEPGLPGLADSLRQGPIFDDPRWAASRQLAKVSGRALSQMDVLGMVATLRAGIADPQQRGGVAIEELTAADWGLAEILRLRDALDQLGPAARQVLVYVGPSIVAQVGRVDLRAPLPDTLAQCLDTLRRSGAVLLEMYGAGAQPLSAAQLADYPTRWLARFPAEEAGRLHLLIGPGRDVGQAEVWARARATAAGRAILANGVSAYGLSTTQDGLDWLRQLRAYQAAPELAPTGERPVSAGGGLTVTLNERTLRITVTRPGRVTVSLVPVDTSIARRTIRTLVGPVTDQAVALPSDIRPGSYAIVTVALGDGLRDTSNIPLVVGGPQPRTILTPLALTRTGRTLYVTVGAGNQVVIRLDPPQGPNRAIVKLTGPLRRHRVRVPRDLVPGVHIAHAFATGADGSQTAARRLRVL